MGRDYGGFESVRGQWLGAEEMAESESKSENERRKEKGSEKK